jgi:hypothetical protein
MTFPAQLLSYINSQQNQVSYTTAGVSSYFTVPEGVTSLSAVCIGAGGGGGGTGSDSFAAGGGGGGGLTWGIFSVVPGDVLEIFVGTAGVAGAASNAAAGVGGAGGDTYIRLFSRVGGGAGVGGNILIAEGGRGGGKATTNTGSAAGGAGGRGGSTSYGAPTNAGITVFKYNGGAGGNGGSCTGGGAGGGGAGGYIGAGGNGGSVNPNTVATSAVTGSGGGGGGGGTGTGGLSQKGYGGGGVGAYGIDITGELNSTGEPGSNDTGSGGSGGGGGSFFNDPGLGIAAQYISESVSTTTSIDYPVGITTGDFLLLMSGSDVYTGDRQLATNFTSIPVPVGFTTISQSVNGVYRISSSGIATEAIPANVTAIANKSRDLNFTSSYRFVPEGGLSGTLAGLTTSSVHNMFALRFLPNPPTINYLTTSGNPGLQVNTGGSLMPNPPAYVGTPRGAFSLALGYLTNAILLSPGSTTAGAGTTEIATVNGGRTPPRGGEGVGLVASYRQVATGTTETFDPGPFLTGTTSHARAWSIEVPRSNTANPVSIIGTASTSTWNEPDTDNFTLPTTLDISGIVSDGCTVMVISAYDNNATPSTPQLTGVALDRFIAGSSGPASFDTGGMGWNIRWGIWNTGDGTNITNLEEASTNIPAAHLVITFSNANIPATPNAPSFDNNSTFYGSPNPPQITTTQNGSLILAIGMVDNIRVSNITSVQEPINGYSPITVQTYGVTDNGAILMSAYKNNLDPDTQDIPGTEDPEPFRGNGGNVWVAQTIIIGGPGSNTSGGPNNAGQWGGGGGSGRENESVSGMAGAQGSARIMWGNSRQYPASATAGNAPIVLDWTP